MIINFYNQDNLMDKDIDEKEIRCKAVIINSNNEVLLGYCGKTYQFPGGHLREKETLSEALIREVREETGIELGNKEYIPFYQNKYYTKNYNDTGKNRENDVYYFLIREDLNYNLDNTNYDDYERDNNYTLKYIPLNDAEKVLDATKYDAPINEIIVKEMVEVLNKIINN